MKIKNKRTLKMVLLLDMFIIKMRKNGNGELLKVQNQEEGKRKNSKVKRFLYQTF